MRRFDNTSIISILFITAITVRLLPTIGSGLPYNIDGYPLARISELMISSGGVPDYQLQTGLIAYNLKLPVFSLLLTSFSLVMGISPLELLPYFGAVVGAISVVLIYAFVNMITKNQLAAIGAGIFLTFSGFFVYVTTAAMKELVGIVLLCLLVYVYSRREDWRFRFISVLLLVLLPLTHHLTSLVAFIMITIIALVNIFQNDNYDRSWSKNAVKEMMLGPGLGLLALYYYRSVGMEFFSDVSNLNDTVLLISVSIIALIITFILTRPVTTRPWFIFRIKGKNIPIHAVFDEKTLVFVGALGLLYLNSRTRLYAGAPMTSELLMSLIIPYAVLALFAMAGLNIMRYAKFKDKPVVLAMVITPLALMIFSALRGLDLFNFTLAYRAFNFVDIGLAVLVGICIAYLIKLAMEFAKKHKAFRVVPGGIFVIFCIIAIASLPLAYNNFEAFGIQEVTEDYEFDALEWTASANISNISTDQRYTDIISPYFNVSSDWTNIWRIAQGSVAEGETILISEGWTEYGAQMAVFDRVVITGEVLDSIKDSGNVIYAGGPVSSQIYVIVVTGP